MRGREGEDGGARRPMEGRKNVGGRRMKEGGRMYRRE
jgi:hypothetical protein